MSRESFEAFPIGRVESTLGDRASAPKQPDEGAPAAWLVLDDEVAPALEGIAVGDSLLVLTWLHRADRGTLRVHPRGDPSRPAQGVFGTRSPDRPNPVGLHRVRVVSVEPGRIRVDALEAIDGTPILDLKPVLSGAADER